MISKNKGIIMADYIVDNVIRNLDDRIEVSGFVDAFNNCREQGYIMYLYSTNGSAGLDNYLTIYIYAHRNTDLPTITWSHTFGGQLYSEEDWLKRTKSFESVDDTIMEVCELIAEKFRKNKN